LAARHPKRPYTLDYIVLLFCDFVEVHGDRKYADDPAIVAGFATYKGAPIAVIGHQKGRDTREKVRRNFGMPRPEGYRKAVRVMDLAERFRRPLFTFVDTPGAYPGKGAEERGQAEAIAVSLRTRRRRTTRSRRPSWGSTWWPASKISGPWRPTNASRHVTRSSGGWVFSGRRSSSELSLGLLPQRLHPVPVLRGDPESFQGQR